MWHAKARETVLNGLTKGPAAAAATLLGAHDRPWMPYHLRELADVLRLSIEIEAPFYHLQPVPLGPEFEAALKNLVLACAKFGVPARVVSVDTPRATPRDTKRTLRFSFHTHGNEPSWWHLKDAHLPERFYFNRSGYSGWVKLSAEQERFINDTNATGAFDLSLPQSALMTKYEQPVTDVEIPKGALFFPLQLLDDTVAQHQRLDPIAVLTTAAASATRERPLVVKRHPKCTDESVTAALAALTGKPHVHVLDIPVQRAFAAASAVLTGNSSVGFAALCAYKPVITFAGSDYEICTFSVATMDQLGEALHSNITADPARYDRFFDVYFNQLTFALHDQTAWDRKVVGAIAEAVRGFEASELTAIANADPSRPKP